MKTTIFILYSMLRTKLHAQKTIVPAHKTSKTEIKTSRLDFNVNLRTSHLWRGLVINDGMTATGYIHYVWTKNKLYRWFWGGAGFDGKYTEINYFVQYQKNNLSLHCGIYSMTGIETPRVIMTNELLHISLI
jgi:hypothetical protein